ATANDRFVERPSRVGKTRTVVVFITGPETHRACDRGSHVDISRRKVVDEMPAEVRTDRSAEVVKLTLARGTVHAQTSCELRTCVRVHDTVDRRYERRRTIAIDTAFTVALIDVGGISWSGKPAIVVLG